MLSSGAGTSSKIPLQESVLVIPATLITLPFSFCEISCSITHFNFKKLQPSRWHLIHHWIRLTLMFFMWNNHPMTKAYPDQIPNTPIVLNSTEISGDDTQEMVSISSIASPEPEIVTIDDDSNEPTMPYGFGRQLPIVPPSLNDLNLPPNFFNILATMAIANNTEDANNKNYSPESPEPSEASPISTPPMNVSAFNSWETSYTTTDDDTFPSSGESRKIYFLPPSHSPPP